MMRILLVRHGESLGNVDPATHQQMADHTIPLSARGIEQAQEAGRQIAFFFEQRYPITLVGHAPAPRPRVRLWTSPYARARQTSDAIQEVAGDWITERREHILLCEQQFGIFEGVSDEELPSRFPIEWAHYQKCVQQEGKFWARMPMGESRFDVATRVHQAFGTFHRDRNYNDIDHLVIVLHGVTMRAFVMMWCHYPPEWFESEPNPDNGAIWLLEGNQDRGYLCRGGKFGLSAVEAAALDGEPE